MLDPHHACAMGQSCGVSQCGQNCGASQCGFGNHRHGSSRASGCGAPKLPALPLRGGLPCGGQDEPDGEEYLQFHSGAFQISIAQPPEKENDSHRSSGSPTAGSREGWQSAYKIGALLGDGISAKVYEAEALIPGLDGGAGGNFDPSGVWGSCGGVGVPQCLRERGRRVAIKRFHRPGSRTFQKELSALRQVGVFPHVLRLLESYEGFGGEDVLVLEYCDGSTLYDLYAREHPHGGLPERLIAKLIRQLLLALEHLAACGVEHQDVKPENMMLHDVSVQGAQAELKLGDFGWAAIAPPPGSGKANKLPSTGAGSLWYAPPELNPPVESVPLPQDPPLDSRGNLIVGRSDMWSVGVVLYLLLIGHNPFNVALKQNSQDAVDNEVLRLAALGSFNKRTEKWINLHMDARDLIGVLLRVRPGARPSASEALCHPFVTRRVPKNYGESSVFYHGTMPTWADRDLAWRRLDGFQRLSWLAVARAVAEPELDRSIVAAALEGMANSDAPMGSREASYLWQLAEELATTPVFQWLQDRGSWSDVLRLAFAFLDLDGDGLLSPPDLASHVARPSRHSSDDAVLDENAMATTTSVAWSMACRWVARWQDPQAIQAPLTARGHPGLAMASFREALLSSRGPDDAIIGSFEGMGTPTAHGGSVRPPRTATEPTGNSATKADAFKPNSASKNNHNNGRRDEEEISWTAISP